MHYLILCFHAFSLLLTFLIDQIFFYFFLLLLLPLFW